MSPVSKQTEEQIEVAKIAKIKSKEQQADAMVAPCKCPLCKKSEIVIERLHERTHDRPWRPATNSKFSRIPSYVARCTSPGCWHGPIADDPVTAAHLWLKVMGVKGN
jgi:hypothetical protein